MTRSRSRARVLLAALFTVVMVVLALPGMASAAFPGANGPIVFTSFRDGNRNIYRVASANPADPEIQLTTSGADDYTPFVDKLSSKVVFVSTRPVQGIGRERIWTMGINGASQTNVSLTTAIDSQPAWSPDGTKIVFTSDADGYKQIWIMNADGSSRQRLFAAPSGFVDTQPVWSPDGTTIAFVSARPSGVGPITISRIVLAPINGSSSTVISTGPNSDFKPDWKPDGAKLAFSSVDSGGTPQVWVMDANGANRTQITSGDQSDEPAFSPDGSYIVFRRQLTATTVVTMAIQGPGNAPIAITDAASTNEEPNWGPGSPDLVVPEASRVWMLPVFGALSVAGALVIMRRRRVVAAG